MKGHTTEIKLFNTLSGKKEAFKPLRAGHVGMYHCGPTVYDDAHIGNLRSYVFADILRRTFEYNGYSIDQIVNITDVGHLTSDADEGEDKMTKALKRLGKPLTLDAMRETASVYEDHFKEDLVLLDIETPSAFPRASDHIKDDIELIHTLEKNGYAYKISRGVCFDTSKFGTYGKLGNIKLDSLKDGARVSTDPEKRNQTDFWLWKFDDNLGWDSPWGRGFPGWHIECSAMSRKYLGQPFDIHTGGIDHIPVHHNNEIAQSEAAYGVPLARYWIHNAFLTMNRSKMAKSAGGFVTLKTLVTNDLSPLAYRYWLLTGHYRSPMDFSYEAIKAAQNAYKRLQEAMAGYPEGGKVDAGFVGRFKALINDDLDTPKALALAWELIKDAGVDDADKRATLLDFDRVFGLKLGSLPCPTDEVIPDNVRALADEREQARQAKDWKKADKLRGEIERLGYELRDAAGGAAIKKKV
ncbi:MAG: cysteine--tRNA ligase [Patescibacteria group bacterium]|nr:cysteine--tRNA ligase [Patescibacteria group bacterium]